MRGSIVKRGEGRYSIVFRATDPATGKARQVWKSGYRTKRLAEDALKDEVRRVDEGTWTPPTKQTLGEYLSETWLPAVKVSLRPTTLGLYEDQVNHYIKPRLGGVQLMALTAPQLNAFYGELLESGRKDGGKLSSRSVEIVHVVIRRALRDAVKWVYSPATRRHRLIRHGARLPRRHVGAPSRWSLSSCP